MRCARLWLLVLLAACGDARADAPRSFGVVQRGAAAQPILWDELSNAEIDATGLHLTHGPASARSRQLQLSSLQLYQVSVSMARGPGSALRFALAYRDGDGREQEWWPNWQSSDAVRCDTLPLSLRPQRYVQGFVLPPGATQPQLRLRMDPGTSPQLARYNHWDLAELRVEALQAVRCCGQLGRNRLAGSDLEGPEQAGLPLGWSQPQRSPQDRLELVLLRDEPQRAHVIRASGGGKFLSASLPVTVTRGSAWRLSALARGRGDILLSVHALSSELPVQVRMTNTRKEADRVAVHSKQWSLVSTIWFAEEAHIAAAQPMLVLLPQGELELDDIELRPFE